MKILLLSEKDMKSAFSMEDAIQADKDALRAYSEGAADIPLRTNLNVPAHEGQSLYMQGYVPACDALGVKIVAVYPRNIDKGLNSVPATMVLQNAETGEVSALLDGTWLTRLRTGAVAGAATAVLARKDSSIFALFGSGGQAETQLHAVLCVRPIREVRIFDISAERAQDFAAKMQKLYGDKFKVTIKAVTSPADAVRDADIVTSVTTARQATFDGKLLKKGCHVNGVGSYTPEMAEIDSHIICTADKVFCDTPDALTESGDFQQPLKRGEYSLDRVSGELGEILAGKKKGRESEDETTVFITTGNAVLDLVTAQRIYEAAKKMQIGEEISF